MKILRLLFLVTTLIAATTSVTAAGRPNILWITSEDNGPQLGCYGDAYAVTPNIDALAARGLRFLNAWSTAPVCAPARTTIITGVYASALGAENMRSEVSLPDYMKLFPQYLQEAGYYCTNNDKEDYNLKQPGKTWDESSKTAHWTNRPAGKPFFAVFNHTISHESQIRNHIDDTDRIHDPARAPLPAYHPDRPEVRKDWAQYYDRLTMMDMKVGQNLRELEEAGLTENTIIFYYGDHGSGMPRSKRWPYNSGLQVPLIVYFPPMWEHLAPKGYGRNQATPQLVGFVDLAPTVLSLAGIKPLPWMQGHAFAGRHTDKPQDYLFGFRGRMDERIDLVRAVRNERFIYIRNYMPHKIYGQYIDYMFQTPTTRVWRELFDEGKLDAIQSRFWQTKPPEELYDLEADPDEVNNLAGSGAHQKVLREMQRAHREHVLQIRDLGFLPESEIHSRDPGFAPFALGHDRFLYPLKKILGMADEASSLDPDAMRDLKRGMKDRDSAVRYWAALGVLMRGVDAVTASRDQLWTMLTDADPAPRIAAAEALGVYGSDADSLAALHVLVEAASGQVNGIYTAMQAMNAIDAMGIRARPAKAEIIALSATDSTAPGKLREYLPNLKESILRNLSR